MRRFPLNEINRKNKIINAGRGGDIFRGAHGASTYHWSLGLRRGLWGRTDGSRRDAMGYSSAACTFLLIYGYGVT